MMGWQALLTEVDRVRDHTHPEVLSELDEALHRRVDELRGADAERIRQRLTELDAEWDIERVLIVNASSIAGLGVATSVAFGRRALVLPAAVLSFLLQHGLQGWCPPLALFRRRGVRTRREIDLERYALKVVRGDFGSPSTAPTESVLDQAARR